MYLYSIVNNYVVWYKILELEALVVCMREGLALSQCSASKYSVVRELLNLMHILLTKVISYYTIFGIY